MRAILFALIAVPAVALADSADGQPQRQLQQQIHKEVTLTLDGQYLLYLPEGYAESDKAWPLLMFLHGIGERGSDLDRVKTHGPAKRIAEGEEFPFIVVSPLCADDQWWSPLLLNAILDKVMAEHRVNEDRVYLTGLSMGGFGTWDLAVDSPERFAAIAPICGRGNPYAADRIKDLPVWVFHGARDEVIPVIESKAMVDALRFVGASPRLTVYPEAGHDSWTETYENPELYEWLLSHSR
jgi:predicted peptidase